MDLTSNFFVLCSELLWIKLADCSDHSKIETRFWYITLYSIITPFDAFEIHRTVKSVLRGHSKRRPKIVFKTDYGLMQIKSIAECSKGSILQYFRPSLRYHLSLKPLFCLFLSGCLRHVLLYLKILWKMERFLLWSKCSIFHNTVKIIQILLKFFLIFFNVI